MTDEEIGAKLWSAVCSCQSTHESVGALARELVAKADAWDLEADAHQASNRKPSHEPGAGGAD